MDFSGTWEIPSSPDFDYDYLSLAMTPYLTIRQSGDRIEGEFQVGLQYGRLPGHVGDENSFYFDSATTRWRRHTAPARTRYRRAV